MDGIVYEIDAKSITKVIGGEQIDIGANPSAEEAEEELEKETKQVIDVVDFFRLVEMGKMDKKAYMGHLKDYMKKVLDKLKEKDADEDTIKQFQDGAKVYAKKILANWNDYDVFMGESVNPEGMHILINYREDGITPYLTIWKHGLVQEKV